MAVIAEMQWLDPRLLKSGRFKVRRGADESAASELIASIRANGVTPQRIAKRFDVNLNRVKDTLALARLDEKSRQQLRPLPGSVWPFSKVAKKRLH